MTRQELEKKYEDMVPEEREQAIATESVRNLDPFFGLTEYGCMAIRYILDGDNLPLQIELGTDNERVHEYGLLIDKRALKMYETMEAQMRKLPQNQKNGDFLHDVQIDNMIRAEINEFIFKELIYVDRLIKE